MASTMGRSGKDWCRGHFQGRLQQQPHRRLCQQRDDQQDKRQR